MKLNIEEWISRVQTQPEHIRMRYLAGCVLVSMILVVGVWSLSVSEGMHALSQDTKSTTSSVQGLIPKASDFSLDSLLSGDKSLEDRKKEVSGEMFFQDQLQSRVKPNFNEEGVVPQGDDTTTDTNQ